MLENEKHTSIWLHQASCVDYFNVQFQCSIYSFIRTATPLELSAEGGARQEVKSRPPVHTAALKLLAIRTAGLP